MQPKYEVKYIDLIDIFKKNTLVVPNYQRAYVWKKDNEINEFYNDFIEGFGDKSKFIFLGNIILCKSNDEVLEVVDGQQRITTIFIMMIALRYIIKDKALLDSEYKEALSEANITLNTYITLRDSKKSTHISSRLNAAPSIKRIIEHMSKQLWDGEFPIKIDGSSVKRERNNVKPIYDFFYEKINELKISELIQFQQELHELKIISIEIEKIEDAFELFERTNARGKELEISDLLKNHLFSKIPQKEIEDQWSTITDNTNNIAQFIKYFYVSKYGYVKKADLYRNIKNKYGNNMIELRDDLLQFSKFYNVITSKDIDIDNIYDEFVEIGVKARTNDRIGYIFESLNALFFFRVTQTIPLIYSFKNKFMDLDLNANSKFKNTMNSFIKFLENYHFINNIVCTRVGNDVEKLYASYSQKFNNAKDESELSSILLELKDILKNKLAGYDEFRSEFVDLSYSSKNTANILYIFDRLNSIDNKNKPLSHASFPQIFKRKIRDVQGAFNIEHWQPQDKFEKLGNDSIGHNIGNLIVVPVKLNSKLGNKDPFEKGNFMKNSSENILQHNIDFILNYEDKFSNWDEDAIKSRANDLAKFSYDVVWKLSTGLN